MSIRRRHLLWLCKLLILCVRSHVFALELPVKVDGAVRIISFEVSQNASAVAEGFAARWGLQSKEQRVIAEHIRSVQARAVAGQRQRHGVVRAASSSEEMPGASVVTSTNTAAGVDAVTRLHRLLQRADALYSAHAHQPMDGSEQGRKARAALLQAGALYDSVASAAASASAGARALAIASRAQLNGGAVLNAMGNRTGAARRFAAVLQTSATTIIRHDAARYLSLVRSKSAVELAHGRSKGGGTDKLEARRDTTRTLLLQGAVFAAIAAVIYAPSAEERIERLFELAEALWAHTSSAHVTGDAGRAAVLAYVASLTAAGGQHTILFSPGGAQRARGEALHGAKAAPALLRLGHVLSGDLGSRIWGLLLDAKMQGDVTRIITGAGEGPGCDSVAVTAAAAQLVGEDDQDSYNTQVTAAPGGAAELKLSIAAALRCAGIVLPALGATHQVPAVTERDALAAAERCFRAVAALSPASVTAQQHIVGFAVAQWRAAVSNAGGATSGGDIAVGEGSAKAHENSVVSAAQALLHRADLRANVTSSSHQWAEEELNAIINAHLALGNVASSRAASGARGEWGWDAAVRHYLRALDSFDNARIIAGFAGSSSALAEAEATQSASVLSPRRVLRGGAVTAGQRVAGLAASNLAIALMSGGSFALSSTEPTAVNAACPKWLVGRTGSCNDYDRNTVALHAARRAAALAPDHADGFATLGLLLVRHAAALQSAAAHAGPAGVAAGADGDEAESAVEAEAAYRRAIELSPTHMAALANLGTLLHSLARWRTRSSEAEAVYRRALTLVPTHTVTLLNLGSLLHSLRRFPEAEIPLRRAMQLSSAAAELAADKAGALRSNIGEQVGQKSPLPPPPAVPESWARPYAALASTLRRQTPPRLTEAMAVYRQALVDLNRLGDASHSRRVQHHEQLEYKLAATIHEHASTLLSRHAEVAQPSNEARAKLVEAQTAAAQAFDSIVTNDTITDADAGTVDDISTSTRSPRIIVVTVATKETLALDALRASAQASGLPLVVLGQGMDFYFRVKVELPAAWLAAKMGVEANKTAGTTDGEVGSLEIGPQDIILFVDAYDVLLLPAEPLSHAGRFNEDLLPSQAPCTVDSATDTRRSAYDASVMASSGCGWSAIMNDTQLDAGEFRLRSCDDDRDGPVSRQEHAAISSVIFRRFMSTAKAISNTQADGGSCRPPSRLIFGAEVGCYPDRWLWPYFARHLRRHFGIHVPDDPTVSHPVPTITGASNARGLRRVPYPFLNSGSYIGTAADILRLWRASLHSQFQPISDDQRIYTRYYLNTRHKRAPAHAALDHSAELLQTLYKEKRESFRFEIVLSRHCQPSTDACIWRWRMRVRHMVTGKCPLLLHGHGGVPAKRLLFLMGAELGCIRRALGGSRGSSEALAFSASPAAREAVKEGRISPGLQKLLVGDDATRAAFRLWVAQARARPVKTDERSGELSVNVRCDELSALHDTASTDEARQHVPLFFMLESQSTADV